MLLGHVGLSVPAAPSLGRVEHTTTTAHVSESTLTGSVGTTTWNTRDTRDSTTGTPGSGSSVVTGLILNSDRLTLVLVHVAVHVTDQISSERSGEDLRHAQTLLRGLRRLLMREDRHGWSGSRHFV